MIKMKHLLLILTPFAFQFCMGQSIVKHAGAMTNMSSEEFRGNVSLDTLTKKNLFALGPYGKMQGEITVLDGQPMIAQVQEDGSASVSQTWKAEAPFLVYANVTDWVQYEVKASISNVNDIQHVVQQLAKQKGYDVSRPFPFRITTTITELTTHVVTPRSADVAGYQQGRNQANYTYKNIAGELLGFYSEKHQGIYTHKDSYIHVHFISNDRTQMGHVDKIAIPEVTLYPDSIVDRTNTRIVSNPSPCLTDVAVYLTGGRYQFNTFYVQNNLNAMYIVERIDNHIAVKVKLKSGVKPIAIDSLGSLANQKKLSACLLDELKLMEDQFSKKILSFDPAEIYQIEYL